MRVQGKSRSTRTEHRDSFTTSAMRTTTGLALSPKETPQSVSVITKTQLEGRGISSLEDALRTTTGVTVLRDSDRARFQSRGFYIDQIEEDGISSSISGFVGDTIHNAESLTDLALYDHIEVVRGATGLTQADGEPGGTVNAVRKRPTAERKLSGSLGFGRYDAYRAELDASGRLNASGSIRGRFVAAGEKSGSFTQRVNSRQRLLYGVMDFDLADSTTLTAGAMHQHRDAVPDFFGLPRGSVEHPLDLPRDSYSGAYWNDSRFSKLNFFTELRHQFDDNWRLTSTLDYRRDRAFREYSALNSTKSGRTSTAPSSPAAAAAPTTRPNKSPSKTSSPAASKPSAAATTYSPPTATTAAAPNPKPCSTGICGSIPMTRTTNSAPAWAGRAGVIPRSAAIFRLNRLTAH